jgi:hypothetical protein
MSEQQASAGPKAKVEIRTKSWPQIAAVTERIEAQVAQITERRRMSRRPPPLPREEPDDDVDTDPATRAAKERAGARR